MQSAADAIPEIELKIQGNDLGSMITSLRRWIVPANVVRLSAFKRAEGVEFSIDWPDSLALSDNPRYERALRGRVTKDPSLGQTVGCRILWLELARNAKQVANTHPDVFCRWAQARRVFDFAEAELSATGKFEDSKPQITATVKDLREIAERVVEFSPLQNIYALLLERAHPDDKSQIAHAWENLRHVNRNEMPVPYTVRERVVTAKIAAAPDAQVVPGTSVQIGASGGVIKVKVTAAVQDKAGAKYLVLPNYAFASGGSEEVILLVTVDGKEQLFRLGSRSKRQIDHPVALVELADDVEIANVAQGIKVSSTAIANLDMTLRLVDDDGFAEAKVTDVEALIHIRTGADTTIELPPAIVTTRFEGQGNGGAPVLDPVGALVGMLYGGSQTTSVILPLADIFADLGVTLIN